MPSSSSEYASAIARFIDKKNSAEQIRLLLWIAFWLSTSARGFYDANEVVSVRGRTKLGAVNDCVNRIVGYVLSKLQGVQTYPIEVLINDVAEQMVGAQIGLKALHDEVEKRASLN